MRPISRTSLSPRRGRLFHSLHSWIQDRLVDWRGRWSERGLGFVLALVAEGLLVLTVLSLGWIEQDEKPRDRNLVSVSFEASDTKKAAKEPPAPPQHKQAAAAVQTASQPQQVPPSIQPAPSNPAPAAIIPISREQMAIFDLSRMPRQNAPAAAPGRMMGPANFGVPGDSKRVGTAPNGQPMYAAAWYREPYDDELKGYLSTAQGPGWALIVCRTVADFRVDSCVGLDEYPDGSQIQRAVLAAAWQFRVRPPRINGVSQVGTWVRIRIDYGTRRN